MTEETEQRVREIVEELRADIDFELDDVISRIVRGLPEDYFTTLSREDQLRQLKALMAMGVCNLNEEIMLRSDDDRHIAVVARKNYPGLLANILKRIPADMPLVGARIFTSTDHDFIIDLFEFKHNGDADTAAAPIEPFEVVQTIEDVARLTGQSPECIKEFVSHYDPANRVLRSPQEVTEQFLVYQDTQQSGGTSVRWVEVPNADQTRVTIASGLLQAKDVFQKTAEFLAERSLDIEQAFLHDIPVDQNVRIAIASFLVSAVRTESLATNQPALTDSLPLAAEELAGYL